MIARPAAPARHRTGRALLLALVMVLLLQPALAATQSGADAPLPPGGVWTSTRVLVLDASQPDWRPTIARTVDEFNAMLPKHAPTLVYRPVAEVPCQTFAHDAYPGTIVVCTSSTLGLSGATDLLGDHGQIVSAVMQLRPFAEFANAGLGLACHEAMHATTMINDVPCCPEQDSSCVWGTLQAPGSFDAAYARYVYGRHRQHRHQTHDRHDAGRGVQRQAMNGPTPSSGAISHTRHQASASSSVLP